MAANGDDARGRAGTGEEKSERTKIRPKFTLRKIEYHDFNVHVVTWNVASFSPGPTEVQSLFVPQEGFATRDLLSGCDVIVVGLQEAYQRVQEVVTSSIPVVGRDTHVEAFSNHLAGKGFTRLAFTRILGIVAMVFVKIPLLCYVHDVMTCTTRTGLGGWLGNKGAVSIRFSLVDLSICFVNCHLIAQRENNDRRISELHDVFVEQIFQGSSLPDMKPMDHDVLVLFGDLNFRLIEKEFKEVKDMVKEGKSKELLKLDQLILEQIKGEDSPSKLSEFMEMDIDFQPSYRYATGSDEYTDGGKSRVPAWCDRVLWRIHNRRFPQINDLNPQSVLRGEYYCVHQQPRSSDHKAVSAGFKLSVDISHCLPSIEFELDGWVSGVKGKVKFTVKKGTEISMWDWVGLYPSHFSSLDRDYVLWILTPAHRGTASRDVTYSKSLTPDQLRIPPGSYLLLYKSYATDRVLGMTPIFSISSFDK